MEHTNNPDDLAFTTPTSEVMVLFGYSSEQGGPVVPCKVTIEFPTGKGYTATRAALSVMSMRDGARNILSQLTAMQDEETITRADKYMFDALMRESGLDDA